MAYQGRVLQGVGGGGLLTLANICIGDMFSVRYAMLEITRRGGDRG